MTQVVKTVQFSKQKRLKGCTLKNGKMSVLKVGRKKYRLVVIYGCGDYSEKLYVVKQSYDLSTNTLSGPPPLPYPRADLCLCAAL